jgi:hypothetical protein
MKDAPESASVTLEFKDGRFKAIADEMGVVATARYTVEGDVMSLVYDAPAPPGYVPGNVYRQAGGSSAGRYGSLGSRAPTSTSC